MARRQTEIGDGLIHEIRGRLAQNLAVRRTLPDGGRIHIDRQLPFLVVYRLPPGGSDRSTARFVRGEAAHLVAPGSERHRHAVAALVSAVADEMVALFGGFLVMELWTSPADSGIPNSGLPAKPGFRVVVPSRDAEKASVTQMVASLGRVRVLDRKADVMLAPGERLSPPGLPRLSRSFGTAGSQVRFIGIEMRPIHRDPAVDGEYPGVARSLHRQLSTAMQQAAYQFALHQTTHRPRHYQALGRRALVRAASQVDARLAGIASAFDLLLLVSPINTERAYRSFLRAKESRSPSFHYRPIDVEPSILKRRLYDAPIERVEDPTLSAIFSEKQRELSLKLDLLSDRGTDRFVHTGAALYGDVDAPMVTESQALLDRLAPSSKRERAPTVDAAVVADAARHAIERYRESYPAFGAEVQVRTDITALMVSAGHLLVPATMRFPARRLEALIEHEVGTHVITYWNGAAQPLKLLATGLAGHDELQEGLAVLAEYLVAGLTAARLRTIAGRVVAARSVVDGAEFMDTYRLLAGGHGFAGRAAFFMATRVHRGGGFVKDAVYLRGLRRVVSFLAEGGRIDTLLVGKIAVDHVAVIEELQRRGVLLRPPLRPAYLDEPDTHYRLERLRETDALDALAEPR